MSHRPSTSALLQQKLSAWQPSFSPQCVVSSFVAFGVIFISIGVAVIVASDHVVELTFRYDHLQTCHWFDQNSTDNACSPIVMNFSLPTTVKAPITLYYELSGYYQNHRRYAKSKNDAQNYGSVVTPDLLTDCSPLQSPGQRGEIPIGANSTVLFNQVTAVDMRSVSYDPCGLIAWSMFNDSFVLSQVGPSTSLVCDTANFDAYGNVLRPAPPMSCVKTGIAWSSDARVKYHESPLPDPTSLTWRGWPNATAGWGVASTTTTASPVNVTNTAAPLSTTPFTAPLSNGGNLSLAVYAQRGWYVGEPGHAIPNPMDEDFMVWNRVAALPHFRKRLRYITADLLPGDYSLVVSQRYDVSRFGGQKSFVVSTESWIGGKNYVLGILYVVIGSVMVVCAAVFAAKRLLTPDRMLMT